MDATPQSLNKTYVEEEDLLNNTTVEKLYSKYFFGRD